MHTSSSLLTSPPEHFSANSLSGGILCADVTVLPSTPPITIKPVIILSNYINRPSVYTEGAKLRPALVTLVLYAHQQLT